MATTDEKIGEIRRSVDELLDRVNQAIEVVGKLHTKVEKLLTGCTERHRTLNRELMRALLALDGEPGKNKNGVITRLRLVEQDQDAIRATMEDRWDALYRWKWIIVGTIASSITAAIAAVVTAILKG